MNSKLHTASTGAISHISDEEGTSYDSGDDYITGKNLQLIKNKLIVQSWRAADWIDSDLDSTFILWFEEKGKDAILNMVHANVPDKHAEGIKKGWNTFYWDNWKLFLEGKPVPKMSM